MAPTTQNFRTEFRAACNTCGKTDKWRDTETKAKADKQAHKSAKPSHEIVIEEKQTNTGS